MRPSAGGALLGQRVGAVWRRWKSLAQTVGDFQARVILSILYYLLLLPVALIMQRVSDPLRLRLHPGSHYHPYHGSATSLHEARRQF